MGGMGDIVVTVLRMVGYLVVASLIGLYLIPPLASYSAKLPVSRRLLSFVVVVTLLFAWAAESSAAWRPSPGPSWSASSWRERPIKRVSKRAFGVAYGFFVPIFFVNIGLQANLRGITGNAWWFALAITLVAVLSKIVGCGAGGLLSGFSRKARCGWASAWSRAARSA